MVVSSPADLFCRWPIRVSATQCSSGWVALTAVGRLLDVSRVQRSTREIFRVLSFEFASVAGLPQPHATRVRIVQLQQNFAGSCLITVKQIRAVEAFSLVAED